MMDPSPGKLAHLMHKKMQNNKKKEKYAILWLLQSARGKMKIRDVLNTDSGQSQLWPLVPRLPLKEYVGEDPDSGQPKVKRLSSEPFPKEKVMLKEIMKKAKIIRDRQKHQGPHPSKVKI